MTTVCNNGGNNNCSNNTNNFNMMTNNTIECEFEGYDQQQIYDDFPDMDLPLDLFEIPDSLFGCYKLPSIQGDVAKIAANSRMSTFSDDDDVDKKPEIRNMNCMWNAFAMANNGAGSSATNIGNNGCNASNSNSAASSYSESSAVPPAIITGGGGNMSIIKKEPMDDNANDDQDQEEEHYYTSSNNSNRPTTATITIPAPTVATQAAIKYAAQQIDKIAKMKTIRNNFNNNNNVEQHIPPGASLLRKSNMQQQQYNKQQRLINNTNNNIIISGNSNNNIIISGNSNNIGTQYMHHDTATTTATATILSQPSAFEEFRHNVDLRACVMGSNNISLTSNEDASAIDNLSRELQNPSKMRIDMGRFDLSIEDVLDTLAQSRHNSQRSNGGAYMSTADDVATSVAADVVTLSPPATTATSSECDSDDGDCSMVDCDSATSMDGTRRHMSDHSYTRCNEMESNIYTPSDSDEEIDVVSLNDNLPTNPSDLDRQALQTKVAHKISNGGRTLPPPRRGRYKLPYTPASSSPVKSIANSRYPSPSSTPYQGANGNTGMTLFSPDSLSHISNSICSSSSRSSSSSGSSSPGSDCATSLAAGATTSTTTTATLLDGKSRKRYYVNDSRSGSDYKLDNSIFVYPLKCNLKSQFGSTTITSAPSAKKSRVKKLNPNDLHVAGNSIVSTTTSVSQQLKTQQQQQQQQQSNANALKRQYSLDEADTIEKRNLHNDMERQRRIGLKNLFEALKKQIPTIRDKERAPKVNILREAAKLCEELTAEDRDLSVKRQMLKAKLKRQQELLAHLRSKQSAE